MSLKPIVTARHRSIKIQLISGMYICPWIFDDVWTILTLGKHPRAEHCFMIEKVPVIMAWLPTTAARIAITRTGHLNFSNTTIQEYISWVEIISWLLLYFKELQLKIITRHRDVKSDLILNVMVLRKISSLPHVREDQWWINKRCEGYLQIHGGCVLAKTTFDRLKTWIIKASFSKISSSVLASEYYSCRI